MKFVAEEKKRKPSSKSIHWPTPVFSHWKTVGWDQKDEEESDGQSFLDSQKAAEAMVSIYQIQLQDQQGFGQQQEGIFSNIHSVILFKSKCKYIF